ncbi:MAG TPA: hypothetical protein VMW91_04645 [Desulfosporosinus sp.]|nr:hypothetical protein [Desulfosporosinus sp.]
MTVKQHLEDKINAYIAKQIWGKISTELDRMVPSGELAEEQKRYRWIIVRGIELLKEYVGKEGKNEKKAKN